MLSILLLTNVTVIFTKIPVFNRQHSIVVGEFLCTVVVNILLKLNLVYHYYYIKRNNSS